MNIENKTILITGGGTGIGFAIAKVLSLKGNDLILVGRREDKLKEAVARLPKASYIVADVTNSTDVENLVQQVSTIFGGLDILVNNAGVVTAYPLESAEGVYEKAKFEMDLNYLSVVRLTERLLPLLKASKEAAIVNIESIVSYLPNAVIATYSATKAALHSYSQSLRLVLQRTHPHIQLFEVFPPFVDTDMTKGFNADKLSPDVVAGDIYNALQKNEYAIRPGLTKEVYHSFLQSPEITLKRFNGIEV
ncbi:SDR family oxidoreductase [Longitalea luteola]|uniref:SDR family oxidoreductase n=1 Tax=Longitalea luteola TaxID=2812563 RepID=UPI001A962131|nr:SDR family NAD(P)-dependent oxidoreductase [Longitalea luteola]